MKTTSLLASLALLATALAFVPTTQAMQLPPPCQTASMTTCCPMDPSFAPCCTVLSCPPQAPRCPDEDIRTSDFLAYMGPHAWVSTDSDCSANACFDASDCSDYGCAYGDGTCCSVDGTQSYCSNFEEPCAPQPIGTASQAAMALPLPHVSYVLHEDCTVTVYETYDCPNGFWDFTTHYDAGPADVWADYCGPMCACMPIEVDAAPELLG